MKLFMSGDLKDTFLKRTGQIVGMLESQVWKEGQLGKLSSNRKRAETKRQIKRGSSEIKWNIYGGKNLFSIQRTKWIWGHSFCPRNRDLSSKFLLSRTREESIHARTEHSHYLVIQGSTGDAICLLLLLSNNLIILRHQEPVPLDSYCHL